MISFPPLHTLTHTGLVCIIIASPLFPPSILICIIALEVTIIIYCIILLLSLSSLICLCLSRYAGSNNAAASELLMSFVDQMLPQKRIAAEVWHARIYIYAHHQVELIFKFKHSDMMNDCQLLTTLLTQDVTERMLKERCTGLVAVSAALVHAGSGHVPLLRMLRRLQKRVGPAYFYGNRMDIYRVNLFFHFLISLGLVITVFIVIVIIVIVVFGSAEWVRYGNRTRIVFNQWINILLFLNF